jgi:hypothetical protein
LGRLESNGTYLIFLQTKTEMHLRFSHVPFCVNYFLLNQHVPIPTIDLMCRRTCCTRTFVPLQVAYARTIHTFQGLSAGPTPTGEQSQYESIVCDPDDRRYEGLNLGLFYTALSRARTLGDDDGLNSAIYFTGADFCEECFRNLAFKPTSFEEYPLANKRTVWVDHLIKHIHPDEFDHLQCDNLLLWATTNVVARTELLDIIDKYTHQLHDSTTAPSIDML